MVTNDQTWSAEKKNIGWMPGVLTINLLQICTHDNLILLLFNKAGLIQPFDLAFPQEVELLEYIDAEELPPLLVDLLDKLSVRLEASQFNVTKHV